MTEVRDVLAPETQVDGFLVKRLLGSGAMGEVYLAQDLALGRRVALKFVRLERLGAAGLEQLLEEARTTARFNHPHIVTIHAIGTFAGRPYLAMEYLGGETLRQRMARGLAPVAEVMRVGRAIAEAIAEAHRHGIVHADLKPENVVLPPDGRLRVLDFGLARHIGGEGAAASGTPAYMSPERWRGTPPSAAMDVWSLGVMLYELLEGHRPVADGDLGRFAFGPQVISAGPRLAEIPGARVVLDCLAVAPQDRPLAEMVARLLQQEMQLALPAGEERSPFRGLRAFTEADALDFFGREAEVDAFVERLRHEPLIPLVGPSGIGKSSFLQAGVISRLKLQERWSVVWTRPGTHPLWRLAFALTPPGAPPVQVDSLAAALKERPGEAVVALRARTRTSGMAELMVFDAFEETFTLGTEEETEAVAKCLAAVAVAEEPWRIVLALRDDYLGRLARLEPLRSHLGAMFVLGPLGPASLEAAITGPLRRVGFRVDQPQLVKRIVEDVRAQPAGLPLLQFACNALWERRDSEKRVLLSDVYEAIGGVSGALASRARQMLLELPEAHVRAVRAMLLRLVTSEGTRRPRPQAQVAEGLGPEAGGLLEKLLANRLVVVTRDAASGEAFVELAHESLAKAWPDLARWLEETGEERALVNELEQAAELWDRRGRLEEETWAGEPLRGALHRVEAWDVRLPERSRAFLAVGARRAKRTQARRRAVGVVGALMVAAAGTTAWAVRERNLEEIRLASADVGVMEISFRHYDFDIASQTWSPSPALPPEEWSLTPAIEGEAPGQTQPYSGRDLKRAPGRWVEGAWRQRVEAPSRPAWLTVRRGSCTPSVIRLQRLPGHQEREAAAVRIIEIPVPTCQASLAGMIVIPAGDYFRPAERTADEEQVPDDEKVFLPRYSIDQTEVTNGQFSLFARILSLTGHQREFPPKHPTYALALLDASPVTGVHAATAQAFCRFMGKTLPGLDEWRKAFRGGADGNPAPHRLTLWESSHRLDEANLAGTDEFPGPAPVNRFPKDVSPYDVRGMAGNVSEWTSDSASQGMFAGFRQVVGGNWETPLDQPHYKVWWINHLLAQRPDFATGLRCLAR